MKVESYRFGRIVIDGTAYERDVLVRPGVLDPNWWRKEGHKLQPADIEEVLREDRPEVLVVGTGKYGLMKVAPETKKLLEELGIELVAEHTEGAVETFNSLEGKKRVVGAFHLTC
ncbi:MAG: Mth938-like domain-containing protein [candidate division KSB1 bacterium]|nr:Mth938-like domain-containing protein [candidate division KSB1 bacterium]MDZ7392751.1 Mth938-like domain-containing protein [candidate division KSB1 bacterium]MDZ7414270.1 Mth938-like domain-containing protein [candidate division KSB1 bacterium]